MIDVPRPITLSSAHTTATPSSNGTTDSARDFAILETLKRDIKAGQHPIYRSTPRPDDLKTLWNGPARSPTTDYIDKRILAPPPATIPPRPSPAPSFAEKASNAPPRESIPVKPSLSEQPVTRETEMDRRVSPPSRYYDQDLDGRREQHLPALNGDRYVPGDRERRPSVHDNRGRRTVPVDNRERHYEFRDRDYHSRDRDRCPAASSLSGAGPLSDRRPLEERPGPQAPADDRRYDERRAFIEAAPRRAPSPLDEHRGLALSRTLVEERQQLVVPSRDDRRYAPMLEEHRRSPSLARRQIYEERRIPASNPDDRLSRVSSLSERLKTPPVSTSVPMKVEPERRQMLEERRPPPPTPPLLTHVPSLSERLKTPPIVSEAAVYSRSRSLSRTRAPSPSPPGPNSYRPGENIYRPPEHSSFRSSQVSSYRLDPAVYRPPPSGPTSTTETNGYRPPANSYRPSESSSYRPVAGRPLEATERYRVGEPTGYRTSDPGSSRPLEYRSSEPSSYRPPESSSYRAGELRPRVDYDRRNDRDSVSRVDGERRLVSPVPLPPLRTSGGWVDDRERGREIDRDRELQRRDDYYHHRPLPLRKRSPSPAVAYGEPKRARYDPEPSRYTSYDRPRSPRR